MNELEIRFRTQRLRLVPLAMADRRYRCLVTLVRADRPRMWNFMCVNCGSKVGELMNMEVSSLSDFYDQQDTRNGGFGRHCKGTLPDGLPCPYSYFFNLN